MKPEKNAEKATPDLVPALVSALKHVHAVVTAHTDKGTATTHDVVDTLARLLANDWKPLLALPNEADRFQIFVAGCDARKAEVLKRLCELAQRVTRHFGGYHNWPTDCFCGEAHTRPILFHFAEDVLKYIETAVNVRLDFGPPEVRRFDATIPDVHLGDTQKSGWTGRHHGSVYPFVVTMATDSRDGRMLAIVEHTEYRFRVLGDGDFHRDVKAAADAKDKAGLARLFWTAVSADAGRLEWLIQRIAEADHDQGYEECQMDVREQLGVAGAFAGEVPARTLRELRRLAADPNCTLEHIRQQLA